MNWLIITGLVGMLGLGFLLNWLVESGWKRDVRKTMAGRPSRSSIQFGQTFYPSYSEVAAKVRDTLSKQLSCDLSQLEPTDQPVADLHLDALDSMGSIEFLAALEKEFDISIPESDTENMRSFDDICKYIIAKLQEKRSE